MENAKQQNIISGFLKPWNDFLKENKKEVAETRLLVKWLTHIPEDLSLDPQSPPKWGKCYVPVAAEQWAWRQKDPEAHWPASWAQTINYKLEGERLCLKKWQRAIKAR